MRQKPLKYLLLSLIVMGLLGAYEDKLPEPIQDFLAGYNGQAEKPVDTSNIVLSDQRAKHILYGDNNGGGHKHGVGTPCKSEFPAYWDDEMILSTTKKIAANDNLRWRQEDNGYHVTEAKEDGVNVRVVLGPQRTRVITSYPTNMPLNPCPTNDR